ncbi:MAG: S-methyl-5'-thioadenosine phosphorylase [Candidatus Bathyarchaeota archaeon]|jgi:5'-methylthioadenosine phosphorylase
MKTSKKAEIAVIGGTGFEELFEYSEELVIETQFGISPTIYIGKIGSRDVLFLPRHGRDHSIPPHKINFKANIDALRKIGVKRIFATNAVGAINQNFKPGDIIVPHDFIDFTKLRNTTFYNEAPVTHIDVSHPYCPEIRKIIKKTAEELDIDIQDKAVLVCTEGPRYETPAEINMFRILGCDIVGMTMVPEVVLAREAEICYASVCYVSNMAAGMQKQLTAHEISKVLRNAFPRIEQILIETIKVLPTERECPCATALEEARLG